MLVFLIIIIIVYCCNQFALIHKIKIDLRTNDIFIMKDLAMVISSFAKFSIFHNHHLLHDIIIISYLKYCNSQVFLILTKCVQFFLLFYAYSKNRLSEFNKEIYCNRNFYDVRYFLTCNSICMWYREILKLLRNMNIFENALRNVWCLFLL